MIYGLSRLDKIRRSLSSLSYSVASMELTRFEEVVCVFRACCLLAFCPENSYEWAYKACDATACHRVVHPRLFWYGTPCGPKRSSQALFSGRVRRTRSSGQNFRILVEDMTKADISTLFRFAITLCSTNERCVTYQLGEHGSSRLYF